MNIDKHGYATKGESLIANMPVNLGIKKLKRELRTLYPDMARGAFNRIIRAYKKRGWSEYAGVVRHRGHFPTHPSYKTSSVRITTEDEEITTIKVKNGNKK